MLLLIGAMMKVLQLDELDFEGENDFCDYIDHELGDIIFMKLLDRAGNKIDCRFRKTMN